MIDALPEDAVLALDEAYCDTAPRWRDRASSTADDPRVIRFRTFSKAYGMAGLRVGYALAAPVFRRSLRQDPQPFRCRPHGAGRRTGGAGDQGHLSGSWARRDGAAPDRRHRADNGLTPLPSATNFVTVDCGGDGDFARAVLAGLVARGVFVRMPFAPPQDRCIRVSCGPAAALDAFAAALPQALADARKI
jgi:histidinol-phosphate aminotransferase